MGARGPAPTPKTILEARGSRRAKGRAGEPAPPLKAPSCPAWLSAEAKAEWRRQVKHLLALGVLAEIDRSMLAAYCEAWSELVGLTAGIEALVRADPAGGWAKAVGQGLVNAKNRAVERMVRIAAQFGFAPAARARLAAPAQPKKKSGVATRSREE